MTGVASCIYFSVLLCLTSANVCRGGASKFVRNRLPGWAKSLRNSENFNRVANSAMLSVDCVIFWRGLFCVLKQEKYV